MAMRALLLLALSACMTRDSAPAAGASDSTGAAISPGAQQAAGAMSRDKLFDATGDGRAERFSLSAAGPRVDSLTVRLTIEDADGAVLRRDAWNSAGYFKYLNPSSMTARAIEDTVVAQLGRVLADSSFGAVLAARIAGDSMGRAAMRDAIAYDVATDVWRSSTGHAANAPIPPVAHDSIARIRPDSARVQRLLDEAIAGGRFFRYFRGGEETVVIAWSPSERRFVTVWTCC